MTVQESAREDDAGRQTASSLWLCGLGFLCLIMLGTAVEIDLRLSELFYDPASPQGWFLQKTVPWWWFYRYGEYPTWIVTGGAVGVLCVSMCPRTEVWQRRILALFLLACGGGVVLWQYWTWGAMMRPWIARYGEYPLLVLMAGAVTVWYSMHSSADWSCRRRNCVLLILAVALGPGMLVNGLLKPLWGRPRPRQIELFGGAQLYRSWWQPGHTGGRSLPSGHASTGYVLVAGTCMLAPHRTRWRRALVLSGALTYGSILGLTRIIQGGHFVTDVLWSGCLMCCLVALLHWLLPVPRAVPLLMTRHQIGSDTNFT